MSTRQSSASSIIRDITAGAKSAAKAAALLTERWIMTVAYTRFVYAACPWGTPSPFADAGDVPCAVDYWAMWIWRAAVALPIGYRLPLGRQATALALFTVPFFVPGWVKEKYKFGMILGLMAWSEVVVGVSGGTAAETIARAVGYLPVEEDEQLAVKS